ncbi:MAG: peptide ABC transporter substrate-binding protein [Pelagibacterium sp. SCN 64-44]|nr:MAG: peptide ABC transporter substrate-binding protein [Pelagibacterium sp. SCN 64-44]
MAVPVHLRSLTKAYDQTTVLPRIDLDIEGGEFFTLLGPSGCGKTTLLRMIAGFNSITGGTISFGERVINDLAPAKRNIGMVFQNYAIFPHMTVRGNIEFGLHKRGLSRADIAERTDRIMDVVQIRQLADRMPKNLSGGQQQRVALARAIVIQPTLLLMDEPLSNLDAKLRVDMRNAIREIQREVGITTIYVTHDQEEAMAVSDRIAILDRGNIEQVGSPDQVFLKPASRFVAGFVGRTNFIDFELADAGALRHASSGIALQPTDADRLALRDLKTDKVLVAARPHNIDLVAPDQGLPGTIASSFFLGPEIEYRVRIADGTLIDVAVPSTQPVLAPTTPVGLRIAPETISIFDMETGRRVAGTISGAAA